MHIYGVLNSSTNLHLSIPKELLLEANETNGVYAVAYQDISALVRDSEVVDYTHLRKDVLARLLVGHQMIIERILATQDAIIPMRLGSSAKNEEEVRDFLRKGYDLIKEIFGKISGKIEIDITATWGDFAAILKEVGEEKEIQEFKAKILTNPEGVSTEDQIKIGFMIKKALDKKREACACLIQETLSAVSPDFKVHGLMDDKMVVNTAFLIDRDKREEFDRKVEALNVQFHEKLNFRCVGPLPPYSFYTLEVMKLKAEDLEWAKKRLGISKEITSKNELKKAYQREALSTHPDTQKNSPGAEKEFEEVHRAYKILTEYCGALEQANQKESPILVRVRG
ncbi:MAG: GvpL/GvpF family gas vesicle protein [Candidatus Omnitrophota bacterium]